LGLVTFKKVLAVLAGRCHGENLFTHSVVALDVNSNGDQPLMRSLVSVWRTGISAGGFGDPTCINTSSIDALPQCDRNWGSAASMPATEDRPRWSKGKQKVFPAPDLIAK
jgi:hypothetical protein